MNRCVISSSAAVVSRNVRRGLPVASGEVERITRQHMRSQVAGPDPKIQTDGVGGPLEQYRYTTSGSLG